MKKEPLVAAGVVTLVAFLIVLMVGMAALYFLSYYLRQ